MKYTADCPECKEEFEIGGPRAAQNGLQCAYCGHKFTPEAIHRTTAPADFEEANVSVAPAPVPTPIRSSAPKGISPEALRLQGIADGIGIAGILAAVIAVGAIVLGGIATLNDGENSHPVVFISAGALLSTSFILFLVSQLMHIRATLQKIADK